MKTESTSKLSKFKSFTKIQWIFGILLSLFVIKFLGVHAHLSKC